MTEDSATVHCTEISGEGNTSILSILAGRSNLAEATIYTLWKCPPELR